MASVATLLLLVGGGVGYVLAIRNLQADPMLLLKDEIVREVVSDKVIPEVDPNVVQGVITQVRSGSIEIKTATETVITVSVSTSVQIEKITPKDQAQVMKDLQTSGSFSPMVIDAGQVSDLAVGQAVIVLADAAIEDKAEISAVKISITELKK